MTRWARVAVLVLLLVGAAWAQEAGVTVTGSGTVFAEPDVAVLELGVNIVDRDVRLALSEANRRMARVLAMLEDEGIAPEDIRTTLFSVRREERFSQQGIEPEGLFRVLSNVEVQVGDLERVGELLARAVEVGANNVGGVRFDLLERRELERQARALAVQDAREKAEQLATEAGALLGPVQTIVESGGFGGGLVAERALAAEAVPISAGQLAVQVTVTVRYALQ